jgi:broad specificity phosphatase PhoE
MRPSNLPPPSEEDVEPVEAVVDRLHAFWESMISTLKNTESDTRDGKPIEVLIVSHGAAIKLLLVDLLLLRYRYTFSPKLQLMLESIMRGGNGDVSVVLKHIGLENCCISRVSIGLEDGKGVITAYGDAMHVNAKEGGNADAELSEQVEKKD